MRRDWDAAPLMNATLDLHADAYRFVADELARRGFTASENRVWRACSLQQIFSLRGRGKGRFRKAGPSVRDDLVCRDVR